MRVIVCTASGRRSYRHLFGLLRSIHEKAVGHKPTVGVLNFDLTPEQKRCIEPLVDHVVELGWDIRSTSKQSDGGPPADPENRAKTARPFLPEYFPGYDIYVWINAHAWIQDIVALDCLVEASAEGALAIVPEIDRAYRTQYDHGRSRRWLHRHYNRFFDPTVVEKLWHMPVLNSGVFALHQKAPHWRIWADEFQAAYLRQPDSAAENATLNHIIFTYNLPCHFLPARFNWLINLALPKYCPEDRKFAEPMPPYTPLGIIDLLDAPETAKYVLDCVGGRRKLRTMLEYDPIRAKPVRKWPGVLK